MTVELGLKVGCSDCFFLIKVMFLLNSDFISNRLLHSDMQVCMKKGNFINNISDQYGKYSAGSK